MHAPGWYAEHALDLRLGRHGGRDRPRGAVRAGRGGHAHAYDHLVLATGSQPRRLDVPGGDLDGVVTCARWTTATGCARLLAAGETRRGGRRWVDRARGRRGPRPPGATVTVLVRDRPAAGAPCSVTELAATLRRPAPCATASTCAPARSERRGGRGLPRRRGRARAAERGSWTPTRRRRRDRREPALRAGPRGRARRDGGIAVDALLRTADPRVLAVGDLAPSPTRSWARACASSTGTRPPPAPPTAAATIVGPTSRLRPPALLLHRPVRPRHGVHGLARHAGVRRGRRAG